MKKSQKDQWNRRKLLCPIHTLLAALQSFHVGFVLRHGSKLRRVVGR